MLLPKLIIVNLALTTFEYGPSPSHSKQLGGDPKILKSKKLFELKVNNVTFIEGEEGYLGCLKESNEYNPYNIDWSYGKDLKSLKRIRLKELIFDYPLDKVSKDQAGFYACKFLGGKKPGWKKLFHLTVKGKYCQKSITHSKIKK